MRKQPSIRARRAANNAMWQAIADLNAPGIQDALDAGANPDVSRRNIFPLQAVVNSCDAPFTIAAWNVLVNGGADLEKQVNLLSTWGMAVSLLGSQDGELEAVWAGCPQLRGRLLRNCMMFSNHKKAGLAAEQWAGSLDRVIALPGSHEHSGNMIATFGGEWHRGGLEAAVVERLVAFDLDPRRMDRQDDYVDSLCQAIALYDQHGVIVNEIVRAHGPWLQGDEGINGHKLACQLLKYGEHHRYFRLHNLAPHLVASDTAWATRTMALAAFKCSSTCLMEGYGADPAAILAKQGFSLKAMFDQLEPDEIMDMVHVWQLNHWVDRGNGMPRAVGKAIERVEGFGLDVRGITKPGRCRRAQTRMKYPGATEGMGLMHAWCQGNQVHHDTQGLAVEGLGGFEVPGGLALLDAATLPIQTNPAQGAQLMPRVATLNWALSCGADMDHPGTIVAARRILFALLDHEKEISCTQAQQWVDAVDWLFEHGVDMSGFTHERNLSRINFERPWIWTDKVERLNVALVVAGHERMDDKTNPAATPNGPKPRF